MSNGSGPKAIVSYFFDETMTETERKAITDQII